MRRLSVRARLMSALAALAAANLMLGLVAWIAIDRARDRFDRLHGETLVAVERALVLSRQASDLATLAPYLLTLKSPFRVAQEGGAATALVEAAEIQLPPGDALAPVLADTGAAIANLVAAASDRAALRDLVLRLAAELAQSERRFAAFSAEPGASLAERQDWLSLQRLAAVLLAASRAENLIGVGEFHREYYGLSRRLAGAVAAPGTQALGRLVKLAEGEGGLFDLRRFELARAIDAEAALVRIRYGSAAVIAHSAAVNAAAQATIAEERARTATAISLAKLTILSIGLASTGLALIAALYVSGHVTANLRAISDAMMRLAAGDRSSRLPRGEGAGDEIGKLLYAFRSFRANALRLDRSYRQAAQRTALFGNMMEAISDGVAVLAEGGALVSTNDRLAQVLRIDPASLQGRVVLAEAVAAAGWLVEPGPGGFADLSLPDGHHAEWRESPLPGGGSVALVSDATERRQMEERLARIQRIEALGKVSGEVAHDFGNILSTISGSLHLMETAAPARQLALRQTIGSAVDLGTSLTERLLAFARRQQLDPEVIELNALVEGLADLVGFALHDGVALTIQPSTEPLLAKVDPGQLESAILNLCLNAAQAIEAGGQITISIARLADGAAQIEVADTGKGMSAEVLRHAMEPFFSARIDGTGTGLGLAMVYGFIRQSGGDMRIDSTEGRGTTVCLVLPPVVTDETTAPALPWRRILLVEDDPAQLALARAELALPGVEVVGAEFAAEALEQLAAARFDLVLTDLSLQGQATGWAIAEAALADPRTVCVVVSGRLPDINPLGGQYGARLAVLPKPVTRAGLFAALARSADQHGT
ncbi:MAG: ATP-binding protein [Phaeovulum sp.]|uniref:ATP-binding protein n=1 Tax=Phaeovulum sp. TaxID=2934796 RepID=UPI00273074C6|nr:ATP-binding protein [Phaeovulum sp.]MDP2063422.1 ATP-binding protein [Phaeovulum sp.]